MKAFIVDRYGSADRLRASEVPDLKMGEDDVLISGAIRLVLDRIFPFESTKEAMAYVEKGRAKGKVVVKAR